MLMMFALQVHGFWLVQDAIVSLLGREEVAPRSSVALALSGVTLDPMTELQDVKGFKAGVPLRLVEGKRRDLLCICKRLNCILHEYEDIWWEILITV